MCTAKEEEILNLTTHGRQFKEKGSFMGGRGVNWEVLEVGFNLNNPKTFKIPEPNKKA